jgi:hypothetical protein
MMLPIDQPFRPKKDFFVAWSLIAIVGVAYARPWTFDLPWFSKVACALVVPFTLTFFIYGPILFMRQVVRSGSRGWFVFRTFISVCLSIALFLGVLYLVEGRLSLSGSPLGGILSFFAILYLHLRIGKTARRSSTTETSTRSRSS